MHYKEVSPCRDLAAYIKCFWILEDLSLSGDQPLQKVLPDACPELIVHYGDAFRIKQENGKIIKQPCALIAGPLTRHIEIGSTGKVGMISARFYPGALSAFLPFPVKEITNTYLGLDEIFGEKAGSLQKEVYMAHSFKERKQRVEQFLMEHLKRNRISERVLSQATLEKIMGKQEPIRIDDLTGVMDIGLRHFERKFSLQVGMTPKSFLKIVRFQNVFRIINRKEIKNLTDLTYKAGYFDQSHFYRDFKEFSGYSPKEYFKEDAVLTKLFVSKN